MKMYDRLRPPIMDAHWHGSIATSASGVAYRFPSIW